MSKRPFIRYLPTTKFLPTSLGNRQGQDAARGQAVRPGGRAVYHHISLVAFLAWVGLGADGLSSSCYGPSEAFEHLKSHSYLAMFLALATMFTVVVISACYSHIIEAFPSGGGGYLVASKMLGPRIGALRGLALIVDYVLTVTVSIAAAGDASVRAARPARRRVEGLDGDRRNRGL